MRNSKGKMSLEVAKLKVAEDMYASGLADLDKLVGFEYGANGTSPNCSIDEFDTSVDDETPGPRRRLQTTSDGSEAMLTRPDLMTAEVGRSKRTFQAIVTDISFAAMRYDKGREFYFSKSQLQTEDATGRYLGENKANASTELRLLCKDTCPTNPLLVADGVCSDGGYADLKEQASDDEEKCPLGTDCSDCAQRPMKPESRHASTTLLMTCRDCMSVVRRHDACTEVLRAALGRVGREHPGRGASASIDPTTLSSHVSLTQRPTD